MRIIFSLFIVLTLSLSVISCKNEPKKSTIKHIKYKKNRKESFKDRVSRRGDPHKGSTKRESRLRPDEKIENYLRSYRADLKKKTGAVIAKLNMNLTKKKPNSTLGRFAAEVIKVKAEEYSKEKIDFSILNSGGLRKSLYKGDIKIKDIYELMPFDNHIVVVTLDGLEVKKICNEIVRNHGLPSDNIQIVATKNHYTSCKIGNKEIDNKKIYKIATINYLYKVGENVPTLKKGKLIHNMTNHLFRNAILEFVKEKKVIKKVIPIEYSYKN